MILLSIASVYSIFMYANRWARSTAQLGEIIPFQCFVTVVLSMVVACDYQTAPTPMKFDSESKTHDVLFTNIMIL